MRFRESEERGVTIGLVRGMVWCGGPISLVCWRSEETVILLFTITEILEQQSILFVSLISLRVIGDRLMISDSTALGALHCDIS